MPESGKTHLKEILTHQELTLLRNTILHFMKDPDYSTGEEKGVSFHSVSFGDPLPLEIVIRDWNSNLFNGTGGREYRNGDCYKIYQKLYEGDKIISIDFPDIN